jgi:hypothetical protein
MYAAAVMVLICYVTYLALRYLLTSLAVAGAPAQIVELPKRLDRSLLGTERAAWRAIEATEHARTPLAHYHRLDSWISPDRANGCTTSGCHAPLPHAKRKEVRAFLNMHATSIHCGVCHMKSDDRPLALTWYDLSTGRTRPPPALLEAVGIVMESERPPKDEKAAIAMQAKLAERVRTASDEAGQSTALRELAEHVAAVRVTSEAFDKLWTAAREALPRHFRGEYGAKVALRGGAKGQPVLAHPGTAQAVRAFLDRGAASSAEERQKLLAAVHPLKRDQALHCTDCHTSDRSLVDFSKIGYPRTRIEALTSPVIFRMIEHINSGHPMHLPEVMRPKPTSASGTERP